MAAFDYAGAAADATGLLTDFGQTITHTSIVVGTYDPTTGLITGASSTPQSGIGVLLEFNYKESGVMQAAGVLVQENDRKLLLSVSGITIAPKPNDTVTADGITYTVLPTKTLRPATTTVMYTLHLRR